MKQNEMMSEPTASVYSLAVPSKQRTIVRGLSFFTLTSSESDMGAGYKRASTINAESRSYLGAHGIGRRKNQTDSLVDKYQYTHSEVVGCKRSWGHSNDSMDDRCLIKV
jgi:hypothetical protein